MSDLEKGGRRRGAAKRPASAAKGLAAVLSAAELREIVEAGSDWLWQTDAELRHVWLSEPFEQITGLAPSSVLGHDSSALFKPGALDCGNAAMLRAALEAREPFRNLVLELKRARDDCRWISISGFPRHDQDGSFLGYRGLARNVTPVGKALDPAVRADQGARVFLGDLERALEAMALGVVLVDAELRTEIINPAFCRIWNLQPGDVKPGSHFRDLMETNRHSGVYDVPAAQWDSYADCRLAEIAAGDVEPREFRRADGRTIIYSVRALSGDKRLICYYDITALKVREAQLADALERARMAKAVINGVRDPVFLKDADLRYVFVNEAFACLFGQTPRSMRGKRAGDFFPRDRAEQLEQTERAVLETGVLYEVEESEQVAGRCLSRIVRKTRVVMASGKSYVAGFVFDITEIKQREEALKVSMRDADIFRRVFDELPVSTYVKTADLKLEYVNKAWADLTGVPVEQAVGKSDLDFFGEEGQGFFERDLEVLRTGAVNETEEQLTHVDGRIQQLIARKRRIVAQDGSIRLIGSSADVTELKQREADLRDAQRRAVLADRAKSEFLANMSHEIRTPMNGVLGMAELLAKSDLDPKQKTFTDIIVKSGNALLTIINDILDFSKIDAGQLVLNPAPFNLPEAIEDVATLVSTRAKEKDLELVVRVQPGLHHHFVGDVGRIRQIVTNLLGNAVKFTDSGHVLIDVTGTPEGDKTRLTVRVSDTGIGIPADKLDLVFEKFSQVDGSSTRRHEGTGLGLAITSRLVALMGGRIGAESVDGEGSTFWFTLLLPEAEETSRSRPTPLDVTGARILVVDDNAINRAILSEQMQSWAFDACAAESASEGLRVMRAAAELGMAVDCIVLDYQMPEMTGAEMARVVRSTPGMDRTPIVMLTSVDQSLSNSSYRDIAIDAQLIKPARSSVLLATVVSAIQKSRCRGTGDRAAFVAPPPAMRETVKLALPEPRPHLQLPASTPHRVDVLVAEDNEVNQLVFTQILTETGMTFEIVGNGRKAVEAFKDMNPRMILMDVSMPEMNGLEATRTIRGLQEEPSLRVPIVGVTAHALKGDRERCLDAGMDDYLSKPISPRALLEKIERWTRSEAGRIAAAV